MFELQRRRRPRKSPPPRRLKESGAHQEPSGASRGVWRDGLRPGVLSAAASYLFLCRHVSEGVTVEQVDLLSLPPIGKPGKLHHHRWLLRISMHHGSLSS